MSITAIVEALVAAGATPEMILAAVRAAEASQQSTLAARRANDAERAKRYRERHVTSRDVTVTERDDPPPGMVPLSPFPDPIPNPPLNPPTHEISGGARDAFERFRRAYPRRSGPWKPAKEKFLRLVSAGEDPEEIITGAEQFAKLKADSDPTFIPMPATWLNQERWKDPIEIPVQRPANVRQFAKPDDGKSRFKDALARFSGQVPDPAQSHEGFIDGEFKVVGGE